MKQAAFTLLILLFFQHIIAEPISVEPGKIKTHDQGQIFEDKPEQSAMNRIYYGGFVTMNFNTNYSIIGAQPLIAYKFNPKFSVGLQLSLDYISRKQNAIKQSGSDYGASIFSRYRVTPRFYAHTEYSVMNYKIFYTDGSSDRQITPMLFLGGGFSQPLSSNTWLNAQVLFDVLNNENSPYKNWQPYFSLGIGVGF